MAAAPLIAACLLPLALGAEPGLGHDLSVRVESRVDAVAPAAGATTSASVVEVQPRAALTGAGRTGDLALAYAPRYTHADGGPGSADAWLHLATLTGAWRPSATWKVRAAGLALRGTSDLFRLPDPQPGTAGTPPVVQPAPRLTTLAYQSDDLSVDADARLSRRLTLHTGLGGSRQGGLGDTALQALPLSQAGRASAGLDWRLSRVDSLALTLGGSVAHFFDVIAPAPGVDRASWSVWTGRLLATWRRALVRETGAWAGAGAAVAGGDGPGQAGLRWLPAAELGLSHEPRVKGQRIQGGVSLALAPLEDRVRGTVDERADLRGWVTWAPESRLVLRAALSGGVLLSGPSSGETLGSSDLRAGWLASEGVELSLGVRGSLQDHAPGGAPRLLEWSVYLGALASRGGRF